MKVRASDLLAVVAYPTAMDSYEKLFHSPGLNVCHGPGDRDLGPGTISFVKRYPFSTTERAISDVETKDERPRFPLYGTTAVSTWPYNLFS